MENVKLPEGWRLEKLKDLLEDKYAGEWGDEDTDNSGICVIRTTNFTNSGRLDFSNVVTRKIDKKIIEKKKLKYGDIILEKSGGSENQPVGRVVYFDKYEDNHICNNFTHVLRIYDKKAVSKYVMYFLLDIYKKGITEYFQNKTTGIRNLQMKRYLELDIVLPPLETQKKIVDVLEKAEKTLEKRKEAIKLLDELVKSRFIEMFGKLKNNPNNFEIVNLESLTNKITDGVHAKPEYTLEGIPFISVKDINKGKLEFADCKYISKEAHKNYIKRCKPEKEDILYTKVGATYGIPAVVDTDEEFSLYVSVALLKLKKRFVNPIYIREAMRSIDVKRQADRQVKGIGVPDLHLVEIKKFKVFNPPLELQNQFAAFVNQVDKLKFEMQKSLKELEDNFNSLMQKAFNGELYS